MGSNIRRCGNHNGVALAGFASSTLGAFASRFQMPRVGYGLSQSAVRPEQGLIESSNAGLWA